MPPQHGSLSSASLLFPKPPSRSSLHVDPAAPSCPVPCPTPHTWRRGLHCTPGLGAGLHFPDLRPEGGRGHGVPARSVGRAGVRRQGPGGLQRAGLGSSLPGTTQTPRPPANRRKMKTGPWGTAALVPGRATARARVARPCQPGLGAPWTPKSRPWCEEWRGLGQGSRCLLLSGLDRGCGSSAPPGAVPAGSLVTSTAPLETVPGHPSPWPF